MSEPATKKLKLNFDSLSSGVQENLIKMRESKHNLKPILHIDLVTECPKMDFYVARIRDKRMTSKLISELTVKMPLKEHNYLKRVRKNEILLCPCQDHSKDDLKVKLIDLELMLDDLSIVEVVSKEPILKWQNELAQKMWPCNFHTRKELEKLASGEYFDREELIKHRTYMAAAYEVGLLFEKMYKIEHSREYVDENMKLIKLLRGVVIVDPKIDSVVAVGYDRRFINPCQHPIMIAIDNVAKSQNGGAWSYADVFSGDVKLEDGLVLNGIPDVMLQMMQNKFPSLKFGARMSKQKNRDIDASEDLDDCGPYICTGYNVYATNEPCIMCSMALVHARVSKVFFGLENSEYGGVVSKCKLQNVKDLNHHYDVFSGFFNNT